MYYNHLNLTKLPPLLNTLTHLYCFNNRLTSLPEQLPNSLTSLLCSNNRLTTLPELPNSLKVLNCNNNRLTRLVNEENGEQLPDTLINLWCSNNYLTKLPEQIPNSFTFLSCSNNPFLFILKNNVKMFRKYNKTTTSFNYYKVLVVIQVQKCNKYTVKTKYMNRDICRECNRY